MSHWADAARRAILEVHASLPDTATLDERKAAVDAAYPFGMRKWSPYKTWLRARREYLCKYGYVPKGKPLGLSPMEKMMRRAQRSSGREPDGGSNPAA